MPGDTEQRNREIVEELLRGFESVAERLSAGVDPAPTYRPDDHP